MKSNNINLISKTSHDHQKVIFNFSSYNLSEHEKNVLCKVLNFAIKPNKIEYSEYLVPFELLYRDLKKEEISSDDLSIIKARLLDTALTSYQDFVNDKSLPENLSSSEFKKLQSFTKNNNIVIQKADKGNTVVILDKNSYLESVENILKDNSKFLKMDFPIGHEFN